ncbi:uncharacterized protein LOC122863211 isoform X1 [Siniperca chuatsi]|uniref:uncharacterized protein LOC122863211 isoform X1 n=1 Tax=Siniperca chuatsi TaxID=119488 RepID=UPI001CE169B8|nr:uncharacterized protein LOC122863211 isoform X1 [Siniperca chuatsi]
MCPGRCCYAYAASLVRDIGAAFRLLFTPAIKLLVLEMTKLEARRRKYHERPGWWKGMNVTDLRAYVGLLILVGVYRSRGKPVGRRERTGRVDAAMPLKVFHAYSLLLRFDDRETRAARCAGQTGGSQGAGGQVGGVSALLLQLGARDNSGATGTVQRAAAAAASKRKRCQICPRRRTVKRTPCAAGATGTCAEAAHCRTAPRALTGQLAVGQSDPKDTGAPQNSEAAGGLISIFLHWALGYQQCNKLVHRRKDKCCPTGMVYGVRCIS